MNATAITAIALLGAAVATVVVGAYGLRVSRTTSDFLVASAPYVPAATPLPSPANTFPPLHFSASPDSSPSTAPTHCGIPSGSRPAISVCCCSSQRPCDVPGRTPFRTSQSSDSVPGGSDWCRWAVVVTICTLYLVPQYQGAGVALEALLGLPRWIGPVAVATIVIVNVVGGGMRSITLVQAFQYWLKLTAISVPAVALLFTVGSKVDLGQPMPPTVMQQTTVAVGTAVGECRGSGRRNRDRDSGRQAG